MNLEVINFKKDAQRIQMHIPYHAKDWRNSIKALPGFYYLKANKCWSIPNTRDNQDKLRKMAGNRLVFCDKLRIKQKRRSRYFELTEKDNNELSKVEQCILLKGFSQSTKKSYISALAKFFKYFESQELKELTKPQIEGYVARLINKDKISESYQNVTINAIKFYYEQILGFPRAYYEIQRPKRSRSLPNVLSLIEVKRLLSTPKNLKHKAILTLIYSAGLRVGEVIKIRIQDIRSTDKYIFIKSAKGKKDRRVLLSPHLLKLLREYYKVYRPEYWLFEGSDGGQYRTRSIQKIFRRAAEASKINPWATPHTLRHSFATHMVESGVNLRHIQMLLGHSSSKTTEIYTKLIKLDRNVVKSPLDIIMGGGNL